MSIKQTGTQIDLPQTMHIESTTPAAADVVIDAGTAAADENPHAFANPRKEMMDLIFAKRNEQIQKELGLEPGQDATGDDIEGEQPDAAATQAAAGATVTEPAATHATTTTSGQTGEPGAQGASQAQSAADGDVQKKVIVVNGQRMEVTDDDLIRMAQMGMSAQQRFQEAARLRDEAIAIRNQPQQIQQPQQTATVHAQPAPNQQASTVLSDDDARDIARRINYGTEDEQAQAIRDLGVKMASGIGQAQPSFNPQQIAHDASRQALAEINFQTNLQTISTEFNDVFEDRILSLGAADRVNALRNFYASQGVQVPDMQLYREACNFVRQTYLQRNDDPATTATNKANSVQAASNVIPMNDRIERKRAAPQPPAAASKVAQAAAAPAAPTASSIVAQMRKSRHQPVY